MSERVDIRCYREGAKVVLNSYAKAELHSKEWGDPYFGDIGKLLHLEDKYPIVLWSNGKSKAYSEDYLDYCPSELDELQNIIDRIRVLFNELEEKIGRDSK